MVLIGKHKLIIMEKKQKTNLDRVLKWKVFDNNKTEEVSFEYTTHSKERSAQRNICSKKIEIVMDYGKTIFKQGLIFYILGYKNIPEVISPKERKKFKNLIVVVSLDSDKIITCYRSKNPFKHIKKKKKSISKYKKAA